MALEEKMAHHEEAEEEGTNHYEGFYKKFLDPLLRGIAVAVFAVYWVGKFLLYW